MPRINLVNVSPAAVFARGVLRGQIACAIAFSCLTSYSFAQTTRLPGGGTALSQGNISQGVVAIDVPRTTLTPIGAPVFSPPPSSATLGNPLFDPYATGSAAGNYQPALTPGSLPPPSTAPIGSGGLFGGLLSQSASSPSGFGAYPPASYGQPTYVAPPSYTSPPSFGAPSNDYATPAPSPSWQVSPYGNPPAFATPNFGTPNYGAPNFGAPGLGVPNYPSTIYPSGSPSTLFPGGLFGGGGGFGSGGIGGVSANRLLQGPRLRHTFINAGDDPTDLQINTSDASIAFAFPNFLYSNQPLFVVPSFSIHLWDGPKSSSGFDLPGQAFDAFVDFGWQSDPNQILGAELGVRVGVFSDFDAISDNSVRAMAKGLVSFRLTPASTIKGGVYYINRHERDFIPAIGLLYQPNPYTRLDLFFPEPKFAHYWRTIGTYDVWGYVAGEYGGGVWTIKRANGAKDTVDMYDYKISAGLEWGQSNAIRVGRRAAFAELGYVFRRRVEYESGGEFKPDEAFFFRAGIGY